MPDYLMYLLLFAAPVAGGILPFIFVESLKQNLRIILAFSGAYLFSITVLHLLPEIYGHHDHGHGHGENEHFEFLGLFILVGFFLQLILEQLTRGVEHGHVHAEDHIGTGYVTSAMIGLSVHSFLEGLPLSGEFEASLSKTALVLGIAFHHIPAGIALTTLFRFAHLKTSTSIILLIVFALMSPFGAITSRVLSGFVPVVYDMHEILLAIVIGSFFHVSTTILFESGTTHHHFTRKKIAAIIFGTSLSFLTYIFYI